MHHKNIKLIVRKQLKNQFPDWKRLPEKDKKELARKVLAEVVAEYLLANISLSFVLPVLIFQVPA